MKKIIIPFMLLVLTANVNAQLFLGGNLTFNTESGVNKTGSTSNDKPVYVDFNIGPMIGYYVSDDLAFGIEINLGGNGTSTGTGSTASTTTHSKLSFAPFARYHFVKTGNLSLFGQGSLSLGIGKTTYKVGSSTNDGPSSTNFALGIRPGASYELSDKISIEAFIGNIGYSHESAKDNTTTPEKTETTNRLGFNISSDFSLGFIYKFK